MIRINIKGKIVYYSIMFVLAAGLFLNIHRDYLTKEYYNYADYPELTNITVNNDYRLAAEAGETYSGEVTVGPKLTLPKGSYEITFHYSSDTPQEQNWCQVVSDTSVKEDNTVGVVYAAAYFPVEGGLVLPFSLTEEAENVQVKTYTNGGDLQVYGYTLKSTVPLSSDSIAMAVLVILVFVLFRVFCMRTDREIRKGFAEVDREDRLGAILVILLVGVISSMPCFTDFLTNGHDLDYHLTRIEGLKEALLCGQFPVRVNPEFANGYGQANPIMYPELFLYFPALLRCINVSLILSYKLMCILLNILCAGAAYFSFRRITRSSSMGLLMSAFYTLSLYRMNNLYMRAALGEWLGMLFLPLVMYGMYALFYEDQKKWGWSVLAFTLCLQGHLLATEMAIGFAVLFAAFSWKQLKEKGRMGTIVKAGIITLLVNLWYVVPLLYFYRIPLGIASERVALEKNALYLPQIFSTFLYNNNLGEELGTMQQEMPQNLGGIFLIGIVLYLYSAYMKKNLSDKEKKIGHLLLGFGLISLYMTTVYFPWDALQKIQLLNTLAGILQFPMRILVMTTLFLSGVSAIGIYGILRDRCTNKTIVLIGTLAAIIASAYTLDAYTQQNETRLTDATSNYNKNLVYGGLLYYTDTDVNAMMNRPPTVTVTDERVSISAYQKKGTTLKFQCENPTGTSFYAEVPLYYYPGYQAYGNGEELEVRRGENGVINVLVPEGISGEIVVMYREMPLFLLMDVISLLSIAGVLFYFGNEHKLCLAGRNGKKNDNLY